MSGRVPGLFRERGVALGERGDVANYRPLRGACSHRSTSVY